MYDIGVKIKELMKKVIYNEANDDSSEVVVAFGNAQIKVENENFTCNNLLVDNKEKSKEYQ